MKPQYVTETTLSLYFHVAPTPAFELMNVTCTCQEVFSEMKGAQPQRFTRQFDAGKHVQHKQIREDVYSGSAPPRTVPLVEVAELVVPSLKNCVSRGSVKWKKQNMR